MFVFEIRASTILYNFLRSNPSPFPYILPANCCPIIPATFMKAQQLFTLVDISLNNYCLDESKTIQLLETNGQEIAGIILIHSYGEASSHSNFFSKLRSEYPNLSIIDDRCLCEPDFSEPNLSSTDLILYSTGYGKYLDLGMGGFGWLKEGIPYQKSSLPFFPQAAIKMDADLKCIVQTGSRYTYQDSAWLDTGPTPFQPEDYKKIVGSKLSEIRKMKTQINEIYATNLPLEIQFREEFNQWRFNINVPDKNIILTSLFEGGLFASSHYASLGGIMSPDKFTIAETLQSHVINLFNDRYFSIEQAKMTVAIINSRLTRGS